MSNTNTFTILAIDTGQDGIRFSLYRGTALERGRKALAKLDSYVTENWDALKIGEDLPDSKSEARERYFEFHELEGWIMSEVEPE